MMKFRSEPGSVFDRVFYRKETIIIEKSGEPRAVIMPLRDYEDMKRRKEAAKANFFEMVDEIQAKTAQFDPAEMQAAIDEAIEAVRRGKTL